MISSARLAHRTLLAASAALGLMAAPAAAQDAAAVHQRALVLDGHVDVLLPGANPRYFADDGKSFSEIDKLKAGGVDALVYAVAVSTGPQTPEGQAAARAEADAKLAAIHKIAADNPGDVAIAYSADDVRKIVGEGKIAILIGFQNAYSLKPDVAEFDRLQKEGVRVAALNHAGNNAFADSSRPQQGAGEQHGGLSPLGKAAVTRLNDLGVLIDVSQLTPKGVFQTLELSRTPVVATHSAARSLVDNTRNLSDAELDAIKAKDGVVQVVPFNSYLLPQPADYPARLKALRAEYGLPLDRPGYQGADDLPKDRQDAFFAAYRALSPQATVKDYVDHIDYIAKRIGVDHVGIGTDFNHGSGIPGFKDEGEAPNVTRELLARGYTEAQIDAIWGGNFLRALKAAEVGAQPQARAD
ncbi:dipeptidase [Phenylobacterium sp.]|uniref:dipeptidase n=1 Tax=Phenylobacterium sp. TaxID=1871053 RepID=UPI00289A1A71|nr:dipeptidase [Phenylobacterium sp.]